MSNQTLENRVAELERQLPELRQATRLGRRVESVWGTVGMFEKNEFIEDMVREGRKFRDRANQEEL